MAGRRRGVVKAVLAGLLAGVACLAQASPVFAATPTGGDVVRANRPMTGVRAATTSGRVIARRFDGDENSLALLKTASPAEVSAAGQTVTYSYLVTNNGRRTLTGVNVVNTAFSGSGTPPTITCPTTTLAPRQSTTCTATYVVTQADINAGLVTDTAVARGTSSSGETTRSRSSTAVVTALPISSLALLKTANPSSISGAGQTVTYTLEVTNTGNQTLTGINAADTAFGGTGTPPTFTCVPATLTPDATGTCTGTYVTTAADAVAGFSDTATAHGTSPTGQTIDSNASTETVTITAAPSLTLLKIADPTTVTAAGQTITYTLQVVNTGNTTLTGVSAADTAFSGTGPPPTYVCTPTTLTVGEMGTCTGTYVVTQADIDTGSITDTAVAQGTPPVGPAISSNASTVTVADDAITGLAAGKVAEPSTFLAAGDSITYLIDVVNAGNQTVTGVSATDTAFSGTGTPPTYVCTPTSLAPNALATCTGTYVVTPADVAAGSITNSAVATALGPLEQPIASAVTDATVTLLTGAAPGSAPGPAARQPAATGATAGAGRGVGRAGNGTINAQVNEVNGDWASANAPRSYGIGHRRPARHPRGHFRLRHLSRPPWGT